MYLCLICSCLIWLLFMNVQHERGLKWQPSHGAWVTAITNMFSKSNHARVVPLQTPARPSSSVVPIIANPVPAFQQVPEEKVDEIVTRLTTSMTAAVKGRYAPETDDELTLPQKHQSKLGYQQVSERKVDEIVDRLTKSMTVAVRARYAQPPDDLQMLMRQKKPAKICHGILRSSRHAPPDDKAVRFRETPESEHIAE